MFEVVSVPDVGAQEAKEIAPTAAIKGEDMRDMNPPVSFDP